MLKVLIDGQKKSVFLHLCLQRLSWWASCPVKTVTTTAAAAAAAATTTTTTTTTEAHRDQYNPGTS